MIRYGIHVSPTLHLMMPFLENFLFSLLLRKGDQSIGSMGELIGKGMIH